MKIKNNLSSIDVNNFLVISVKNEENIIEKLSSGYRINRAGDDTAGLAISEKMRSQIRSLNQSSRNAEDGISLIQTAEGALDEVHSMLKRMHTLSVQSSNETYTKEDRYSIQKEMDELIKEVDGISTKTEFNHMKLLDGTMAKTSITANSSPLKSVGEGSSMTLEALLNSDSKNLNIIYADETDDFATTTSSVGTATISGNDYLKNVLKTEIVPQAVTGVLGTFSPAFNYLSQSSIGIGLKLYSDSASSTLASVSVGCSLGSGNSVNSTMLTYQLAVNMAGLSYSNGQLTAASRTALETTIVHEMVHAFMDETLTNGMMGITNGVYDTRYTGTQYNYSKSQNSYPTWFKEGMAQSAAGGYSNSNDWVNNGLGINTSTSAAAISSIVKNSSNSLTSGTTASKYATGYLACMYLGYLASGSSNVTAADISTGLGKVLSDLGSGKSLETVISEKTNGKYTNLSDFESKFGDADSSAFIYKLTQVVGSTGNGGLVTGNLTDSDLLPNISSTTSLFSLNTTNDTVKNIYPSGVNVLSGGGKTSTGTVPVDGYISTIANGSGGSTVNPGSTIDLANISPISGINYDSTNNVLTITNSGDYTLKGINPNIRVVVNSGVKANITLNNSSINTADGAGISLQGNADVTLNLEGTNNITTSKNGEAGIRVTTGATLTIQGNGTLNAKNIYSGSAFGAGAGIGGGDGESGGNIIINGGTINAVGGSNAAGIGGGRYGNGGNIVISGGIINATAGDNGAGIGGGAYGDGGSVVITGGNVTANGGTYGAGIGGGLTGAGGNININGSGVIVKATGATGASNIGEGFFGSSGTVAKTTGIIFEGTSGGVYGNVTLGSTLNCDGKTLSVLSGSTLNVSNGGKINNYSSFNNSGVIENRGSIGSVSGTGTTHHYAASILKNIKEPSNITIGDSLSKSIAALSPSTITVSYNGKTRTLIGNWSVSDKDGNPINDLSGTVAGSNDRFIYNLTFASEDGIYFDPLKMSAYNMVSSNQEDLTSDEYVSASGPSGGGNVLTYSYVVDSSEVAESYEEEKGGIRIQVGTKAHQAVNITIESTKSQDLAIGSLSVLTKEDAEKAMDLCDKAIDKVSKIRGSLGAHQNRLEHVMRSINNTEENLQNAESRIRDMDMAKGMIEFSKYQILMKTGQSMLAQANHSAEGVLALLG